ncbi:conserved Plasmodium protein, unknown function [Plasmodium malariae]|uniref:Condensin-2 complex subunit H2 C-terminal domain-containing protein n=1 Tax=Plasmodium malariae TaxID=5858 RepID=A0A1A8VUU2_PLAMA|nr:conserved Plasmodium protein, unknown function [Plasmodium malariae]SBS82594.1 conserved Plasmodium protein, unknown function [Plasmodium malariae]SBT86589.1 conserved Plasmodium protein, unknown function [Plasmodium malariae]
MSTTDELSTLIQNLQKCNNTNECINFDLVSTIQEFLNCLDKNEFEDLDKRISENEKEKEKDHMNSFTSAAIFVENCVKVFGLKIEHLHNLAHNTLYNIHKESKNNNTNKKPLLTSYEEEYLFINEIRNLKNITNENEQVEDETLVKTIPLPTFLFSENVKKKENNEDNKKCSTSNSQIMRLTEDELGKKKKEANEESVAKGKDRNKTDMSDGLDSANERIEEQITEIELIEKNSINSLNFDKIFLENDGILLLDINDYNIFIDDQHDFSIKNKNSTILFEKYDFFSRHSTYISSNNLSKYIEPKKSVEDIYKIFTINDLLSEKLPSDIFLFKQHFSDYDFSLGILKNKKYVLNKFQDQKKYFYILDDNTHMDNNRPIQLLEKNDINKKLPNYYILNCYNIKNSKYFLTYMQPSQILDIIKRNETGYRGDLMGESALFSPHENKQSVKDAQDTTSNNASNDSSAFDENASNLSNDQKLFNQIRIPDIYIQKLGLNFSYYHLEPLLYYLIKDLKKKKNVEKFFSISFSDENANYDFDILKDDEYQEGKDLEGATVEEKLTMDNFMDARSLNDDINDDLPLEVFYKKDSGDGFFVPFDEDIHERVNKWNIFLEEKLELLRKQPRYDVDIYKKNIINYTMNCGDKIPFTNLIRDKEQYQICRNFLTILMLINTDVLNIKEIKRNHGFSNDVTNYEINIKKENVQEYLSASKRFKNTSFAIKDKKRKTELKNGNKDIYPSKRKTEAKNG